MALQHDCAANLKAVTDSTAADSTVVETSDASNSAVAKSRGLDVMPWSKFRYHTEHRGSHHNLHSANLVCDSKQRRLAGAGSPRKCVPFRQVKLHREFRSGQSLCNDAFSNGCRMRQHGCCTVRGCWLHRGRLRWSKPDVVRPVLGGAKSVHCSMIRCNSRCDFLRCRGATSSAVAVPSNY